MTFSCGENDISDTIKDIDGNEYHTVKIGNQVWMVENLKTTRLNDGSLISNYSDSIRSNTTQNNTTGILNTPDLSGYGYFVSNYYKTNPAGKYGLLYNWKTASSNKLAPIGWHIPSIDEWQTLINYVKNNPGKSGSTAKALAATTDWNIVTAQNFEQSEISGLIGNNLALNNSTGFTAYPGVAYDEMGTFIFTLDYGSWWTSTDKNTSFAQTINISNFDSEIYIGIGFKLSGISVRCIKDSI